MSINTLSAHYRRMPNKHNDDKGSMPRHQIGIDEGVYLALDKLRVRDEFGTESWTSFFRRLLRERKK